LQDGRYFSELESQSGRPVCVLGFAVADGLFPNEDPIGKEVRALGRKFKVIGIFESQGDDLFGNSTDENVYIPVEYARKIFPDNVSGSAILAKAKTETGIAPMIDELRATLRGLRRLKPGDADSFSFNRMSMVTQALDGVFLIIKLAGIVIGGFSILVGGFGIANIMFVSVRERTSQIGIQKALGARNNFILLQFLVESVVLCLIGGIIGLILVYLSLLVASNLIDFYIFLSVQNIIRAIVISVVIGLISGIFPAYFASQMQPVDAIRSGQ
jgi:putative ABC transport system permease protein